MKKFMFLLSVLFVASTALAGKGEGGGGDTTPKEIVDIAHYSHISDAIERAPQILNYYMNFFEYVNWGYTSPTIDRNEFQKFVYSFLGTNYRNKLINRSVLPIEIKINGPCEFVVPESNEIKKSEGSFQNGKICLSVSEIFKKRHDINTIQKKVVGLFAHEFAHVMGAGHDKVGENLAINFQDYVEAIIVADRSTLNSSIQEAKYLLDGLDIPSDESIKEMKNDFTQSCMILAELYNIGQDLNVKLIEQPYSYLNTVLIDLKYNLILRDLVVRTQVAKLNCRKEVGDGKIVWSELIAALKIENVETIVSDPLVLASFDGRAKTLARKKLSVLKSQDPRLFQSLTMPTYGDLNKINELVSQIMYDLKIVTSEINKLKPVK